MVTANNYMFEWAKEGRLLVFPIKLEKTVEENWKGDSNLICNDCESSVSQKYICSSCGTQATIGQIKKRKDNDTQLVYTTEEYNQFMKSKVKQKIRVVGEMPLMDFYNPNNIELIEGNFFKIFGDEEYSQYIEKLREYLTLKGVGLLVLVGYYSKERAVILIPTKARILGIFLRDRRLVRGEQALSEELAEFSTDNNIDRHYEFLQLKKENQPIPVVKEEAEKPKIDLFFNEELEQLENSKKLEKPIEVR